MRRALPAAGTFTLTLLFLDPARLPELAAGLGAAAGAAAVILLLTATGCRAARGRPCREVPPPAASPACQPPTQPMSFGLPDFQGWDAIEAEHPPYRDGRLDGDMSPPVDWDALHLNVAREWNWIMRRPDEQPGTADMAEFEEKWKL